MDYNVSYRLKNNGIQAIISYKVNGKWKQKNKQGFENNRVGKRKAKEWAEKTVDELKKNINLNTELEGISFKVLTEIYIDHLSLYKTENTIRLYKLAFSHFSKLDMLEVSKIKSIHLQNCIDQLVKEGLSYNTIKTYTSKISSLFNAAVTQYNVINANPYRNIVIKADKSKKEKNALTENELKHLINTTKNLKYKVIFSLAGMCGMRIGEILGLQWNKIDFKNNTITIDKQWKNISNNKQGFGELKSKNSYRIIPLPNTTKELLLEWDEYKPRDISNRVIKYKNVTGISRLMNDTMKKAGYDITIHELRHTYATTLISKNVDFKTVAKLMGHDVEQTLKTYSHVTDEMYNNAVQVISNIF